MADEAVDSADGAVLAAVVRAQLEIAAADGDVARTLLLAVERANELTNASGATLEMVDDSQLVVRAASGIAAGWVGRRHASTSLGARCLETREPVVCDDVAAAILRGEPLAVPMTSGSFVSVPLVHDGRVAGLLRVVGTAAGGFNDRDLSTLRLLAGFAAVAVEQVKTNLSRQRLMAERTTAVSRLAESERRFRKTFDGAPIGMVLVDLERARVGALLQVNRAFEDMTGRDTRALTSTDLVSLTHPEDRLAMTSMLRDLAGGAEAATQSERRFVRPDGEPVWVSVGASPVLDDNGLPLYAVFHVEDVTSRKEAEAKLTEMALHDPLTGLPNRLLLLDRLQRSLARARRRHSQVALLFCDLDRFKVINDSLGHDTGDALLVALARRISHTLRDHDTAARLGGDEFVVVCEDVCESEAVAVAQRMQEILADPCQVGDDEVVVTTSIGIVMSTGFASPYALLRDADAAMYRAKDGGGGRIEIFDDVLAGQAISRLRTESGLRRALDQGELRVHYQPIVNLGSGAIEGFEALVRWEDPERGLVPPDQFLDVAEETGLIVPIGAWVLEESCRQLADWRRRFPRANWSMAVNLSARQVARSGLANIVAGALRSSGVDPSALCLELTETVLIEAGTSGLAMLRSLKDLGVHLGIDDFGTGYSSLSYLRRFPVDVVKVDRSFVAGLGDEGEDDAIVSAVVGLTQRLGLRAVAEGVETEEQAARLRSMRCDLAQGFLFARPAPPQDLEGVLATSAASSSLTA
jgi:diguanylate cyclase (GGDEF)-like protein/PAS domain S-box-containing protein